MELGICRRAGDPERGGRSTCISQARPTNLFSASSVIDRGTTEPTQQQGYRCTDLLRHIQCPSSVHLSPGCTLAVRTHLRLSQGPLFTCVPGIRLVVQRGSSWIPETASRTPYRFSKGFRCPMLSGGLMLLEGNRGPEFRFCGALRTASVGTSLITYNSYFEKLATTCTRQPSLRLFAPSRKSPVTSPSIPKKRRKIPRVGQKISSCRTETQYRCVCLCGRIRRRMILTPPGDTAGSRAVPGPRNPLQPRTYRSRIRWRSPGCGGRDQPR